MRRIDPYRGNSLGNLKPIHRLFIHNHNIFQGIFPRKQKGKKVSPNTHIS